MKKRDGERKREIIYDARGTASCTQLEGLKLKVVVPLAYWPDYPLTMTRILVSHRATIPPVLLPYSHPLRPTPSIACKYTWTQQHFFCAYSAGVFSRNSANLTRMQSFLSSSLLSSFLIYLSLYISIKLLCGASINIRILLEIKIWIYHRNFDFIKS